MKMKKCNENLATQFFESTPKIDKKMQRCFGEDAEMRWKSGRKTQNSSCFLFFIFFT